MHRRLRRTVPQGLASGLALALLAACGPGVPSDPDADRRDEVPVTLAPRPVAKPQPLIALEPTTPKWRVTGWTQSTTGKEVWDKSLDLVRNWMFKPELVQEHDVEKGELDGLTRYMTDEAAARWRKESAKAIAPWISGSDLKHSQKNEFLITQLVAWQTGVTFGDRRGFQHPMYADATISDAQIMGDSKLWVLFRLNTAFLLRGERRTYEVPYTTVIALYWTRVDGEWRLYDWNRTANFGRERLTGPKEAVAKSKAAHPSSSPTGSASSSPSAPASISPSQAPAGTSGTPSDRPTVTDSAP